MGIYFPKTYSSPFYRFLVCALFRLPRSWWSQRRGHIVMRKLSCRFSKGVYHQDPWCLQMQDGSQNPSLRPGSKDKSWGLPTGKRKMLLLGFQVVTAYSCISLAPDHDVFLAHSPWYPTDCAPRKKKTGWGMVQRTTASFQSWCPDELWSTQQSLKSLGFSTCIWKTFKLTY